MKHNLLKPGPVALFVVLELNLSPAISCSCLRPPPPKEALAKSGAVFAGTVIDVKENSIGHYRTVQFRVDKYWKGASTETAFVTTALNSAACGYEFARGRRYLVYSYARKGQKYWSTNLCTRTAELAVAQADLTALGAGKTPRKSVNKSS